MEQKTNQACYSWCLIGLRHQELTPVGLVKSSARNVTGRAHLCFRGVAVQLLASPKHFDVESALVMEVDMTSSSGAENNVF